MEKRDAVKWLVLAALVALSVSLVWPLHEKINLGLDLRGGTSFVVEIDEAEIEAELIRRADDELDADELARRKADAMRDAQRRALEVIRGRVDELGTREPIIYPERGTHRIVIQLPGASDSERREAEEIIGRVAFLTFHLVHRDNHRLAQALMMERKELPGYRITEYEGRAYYVRDRAEAAEADPRRLFSPGTAPMNYMFILEQRIVPERGQTLYVPICVRQVHEFDGGVLSNARAEMTPLGQHSVSLEFDARGARQFYEVTRDYAPGGNRNPGQEGRQLAIALDHVVHSAPVIQDAISTGNAQITGNFSGEEARRLAMVLRTGALPAPVSIIERRVVDPSLGQDSIDRGVTAILVAGIVVALFMLIYYRLSGAVADTALILNIVLLPLGMVLVSGFLGVFLGTAGGRDPFSLPVLTLPGIAGILLTIGMAVDANVLIYERFREEFKSGKRFQSAIDAGYDRAFLTILDANLTTLMIGVILFIFGSGPIRGFSITLCAGILVSMYTALVVTRMLFKGLGSRFQLKKLTMFAMIKETSIDFMGKRKLMAVVSVVLILVSWALLVGRGMQDPARVLGIDFVSGSSITLSFDRDARPGVDEVRGVLEERGIVGAQIQYQRTMDEVGEYLVINTAFAEGDGNPGLHSMLDEAFPAAAFRVLQQEDIAPQVGTEMRVQALKAILLALGGIVLYISFRFKFGFATGAIAALVHDVLLTAGLFVLLGGQISLPVVAALLTVVGYSVNDSIVVFDRIREDLGLVRNRSFKEICNLSLNQTLSRTVLTSLTTLLAVGTLLALGGGAIRDFALTLFIGVLVGTYSSMFVATPVTLWWHGDKKPDMGASSLPKK